MSSRNQQKNSRQYWQTQQGLYGQNRGQLILISVITLGILLIGITLVLNGFLFAESMESEGVPEGGNEIESVQQMVYTEYGELLIRSNRYDSGDDFGDATTQAKNAIRMQESDAQGQILRISKADEISGKQIRQTSESDFNGPTGDWSINATDVRRFQIAVNQPSDLHGVGSITSTELNDAFHINIIDDSGNVWTVYMAEYGSDAVIAVDDGSGPTKQYEADDSLTLDVVTGSVNETGTESVDRVNIYDYVSNLDLSSSKYTISFKNTNEIEGKYTLTVPEGGFEESGSPDPKNAIYSSTFDLTYESPGYDYEGEIRIAPCSRSDTRCLSYIRAGGT
ncbi:hypothetical protein [Natrinema hispanicum]|uniref:Uncharacterized protein n=1 Tax=Natrinema hispanicum TaxID=392421 RepID=A0A1G6UT13_9EURY|nr:hypothetical protein [Natrinema hispanicum]SDD44433.1 hypothetical protein SAMN05192552_102335 [Natrinema hispanicum]